MPGGGTLGEEPTDGYGNEGRTESIPVRQEICRRQANA